jgi:hypothetical protein
MEPLSYAGASGEQPEPSRRHHRHHHRREWRGSNSGVWLVIASLTLGGIAVGAALYFRGSPAVPQLSPEDVEKASADNARIAMRQMALAEEREELAKAGEPRLLGVWLSDADATIEELRLKQPVNLQQELELRRHMTWKFIFTADTVAIAFRGPAKREPYQIVSKDDKEVVIKMRFDFTEKDEEVRIRFEGPDVCWVDIQLPQIKVHECLRRLR